MYAALPSRPLVLCQIRAPEDAAHAAEGYICGATHDADYDVGVAHGSDSRHGVEGHNSTGDAENQAAEGATVIFGAAHDANGYQEGPGKQIALLKDHGHRFEQQGIDMLTRHICAIAWQGP